MVLIHGLLCNIQHHYNKNRYTSNNILILGIYLFYLFYF